MVFQEANIVNDLYDGPDWHISVVEKTPRTVVHRRLTDRVWPVIPLLMLASQYRYIQDKVLGSHELKKLER